MYYIYITLRPIEYFNILFHKYIETKIYNVICNILLVSK